MSARVVRFSIAISVFAVITALLTYPGMVQAENLTGQVQDPQGKAVADAHVRLFDRNSGEFRSTTSSKDGNYSFQGIPSGSYLLDADGSSGTLASSQEVTVSGDQKLDVKLAISGTKSEVLVTASGTPLNIDEIAKAVDVVDSEDLALRDEFSISEAVRNIPGLRVKTQEGPGSKTTIQMRGLRAQDTAVLIDGMRFRDASGIQGDATAFLEDMNLVDTERIEILRGSGSSLYGSHALGGVINISSRPGGGPTHGQFLVEGGGLGMIRSVGNIGGGFAMDRFTYSGGVSHLNVTKGSRNGLPYRSSSGQGSAKFSFNPKISLSGKLWYSNSYLASSDSPAFTSAVLANSSSTGQVKAIPLPLDQLELFEKGQPFTAGNATYIPSQINPDGRRLGTFFNGGLTLQHQISPNASYHVTYQGVSTKRTYLDGPAGTSLFEPASGSRNNFDGYTNTLQARFDERAGRYNLISLGYEFEAERFVTFNGTAYAATTASSSVKVRQRSNALYVQDQVNMAGGRLQLTIGGRTQWFNLKPPSFAGYITPYSGATLTAPPTAYTGDAALAYFASRTNTKLRGHVGNSFRAPSGYERFGGGSGTYYGDPRLSPERAVAVDGGIDQKLLRSMLTISGTLFYTKLQQTILFAFPLPSGDPFGRFFGYANGGGGIARGVELSGRLSPTTKTNLGMSYTYVNSDSNTPTIGSNYYKMLGISPHAFTLTATQWIGGRSNVTFDMSALSKYTTTLNGGGSRQFVFDGPVKADVAYHCDFPLSDRHTMEFYVKVENLRNKRLYEDGFIGPKAWAITGIKLRY